MAENELSTKNRNILARILQCEPEAVSQESVAANLQWSDFSREIGVGRAALLEFRVWMAHGGFQWRRYPHACWEPINRAREQEARHWQAEVDERLSDMGKYITAQITRRVADEYGELVDGMVLYPEGEHPLWVHAWSLDMVVKRFDLEAALLEWFDVPADEQTASREQMEAWASGLERIASRIRTAVSEGRHAESE
jgi:hypothetical protein